MKTSYKLFQPEFNVLINACIIYRFFLCSCTPGQCLTCVCVWWRWRAFHLSSWWWSCRSADPGIPPPSSGTKATASLWPSCRLTGRSPECRKSERGDGAAGQRYRLQIEPFTVIFEKPVHIFLAKFRLIIYYNIQLEILDFECVFFLIFIGQMLAKIWA